MVKTEMQPFLRSAETLRRGLGLVLVLLCAAALGLVLWVILDTPAAGVWMASQVGQDGTGISGMQAAGLSMLVLSQIGIWIAVVRRARAIFTALLLTDATAASAAARGTARLLWVMVGWGIVAVALATVVGSWHYPVGERTLAIGFGSAQVSTIFAALLASFTAHAFTLGAALWQDHREVI